MCVYIYVCACERDIYGESEYESCVGSKGESYVNRETGSYSNIDRETGNYSNIDSGSES